MKKLLGGLSILGVFFLVMSGYLPRFFEELERHGNHVDTDPFGPEEAL